MEHTAPAFCPGPTKVRVGKESNPATHSGSKARQDKGRDPVAMNLVVLQRVSEAADELKAGVDVDSRMGNGG